MQNEFRVGQLVRRIHRNPLNPGGNILGVISQTDLTPGGNVVIIYNFCDKEGWFCGKSELIFVDVAQLSPDELKDIFPLM